MLVLVAALPLVLSTSASGAPAAEQLVGNLDYPSMFTIAPDGRIFYSELHTGRIGVFNPANGSTTTFAVVPDLCTAGDQGLFGVALHPGFPTVGTVYAYATRRSGDGSCNNQVLRIDPSEAGPQVGVLVSDPYVGVHIGGRLLFGPDGNLYAATGDGSNGLPTLEQSKAQRAKAQDTNSLKGKILRLTPTGGVPAGNPFENYVFAYGFRNVFGLDFDPMTGRLWATDNGPDPGYPGDAAGPGPSGGCNDEVNLVSAGLNYGWGAAGTCAKPPEAPANTNQDGTNPVYPKLLIEAASGITGARFCHGCGLGPDYEGRLFYVDYDYVNGRSDIRAATLNGDRTGLVSDLSVYRPPGTSALSLERGPDGALHYSDQGGIYKLVSGTTTPTTTTTTTTPPGGTHSIFGPSATPSSFGDNRAPYELGTKFRSDVDGVVTGIRFYKAPGDPGTHVGKLWSRTGELLASADFGAESASGWQQVNFASPAAIKANTTYMASFFSSAGRFGFDPNYFGSAVDNPPLHALASGADGPNGLYRAGSGFPTESYLTSNFWVDVVFVATA